MWTLKTKIKSAIWRNNSRSWVDCVRERDRDGQRPRELPLHRDDQREEEAEHPPGGRGIHEATVARQRAITLVLWEIPVERGQTARQVGGGQEEGGGHGRLEMHFMTDLWFPVGIIDHDWVISPGIEWSGLECVSRELREKISGRLCADGLK